MNKISFPPKLLKKLFIFILIANCSLLTINCSKKLDPEPLSLSVKQNLAMLQADPQFVMYFGFKKMRETGFWNKFVSDSLINSEKNFGNFLGLLKEATGVSVTNGIDELFFSNSWIGDNAMVVKGTFDKKRVDDYVSKDTLYKKLPYPNNITVYKQSEVNFYFYFKDDFTVCASNYLKQVESTMSIADTSRTGLLTNDIAMKTIENIKYKDNLWMMSNQKLFIRGIFENFADMNKKGTNPPVNEKDTTAADTSNGMDLTSIYKKISSVSFALKMSDDLDIIMQNNCEDEKSANDLKNRVEAIIALVKISSTLSNKKPIAAMKVLDKIEINVFDKTVLLEAKLDEKSITEIRKQKLF